MKAELEEKILELRSQGQSYEEIARQLEISQQQLMEWTRERQEEVRKKGCGCL